MPKLSKKSQEALGTCAPELQALFNEVIKGINFAVLCGTRGEEDQEKAFRSGVTKVHFPHSKHNALPSLAVDVAPWPIDWKNVSRFHYLAGYIQATADRLGIPVIWGGNWKTFVDLPHWELAR